MDHPSFNVKLLSAGVSRECRGSVAGAGKRFTVSYNDWGRLSNVYVLIEYADPDMPPRLTQNNQCNAIE